MTGEISPSSRLSGMFAAGGYYMRNYLSESNSNDYFEIKQLTGLDKVILMSICSAWNHHYWYVVCFPICMQAMTLSAEIGFPHWNGLSSISCSGIVPFRTIFLHAEYSCHKKWHKMEFCWNKLPLEVYWKTFLMFIRWRPQALWKFILKSFIISPGSHFVFGIFFQMVQSTQCLSEFVGIISNAKVVFLI